MAIFLIGDIHGKLLTLGKLIERFPTESTIICLGDIGLGFSPSQEKEQLVELDTLLDSQKSNMLLMRGNHDDPALWNTYRDMMNEKFRRIHFTKDIDYFYHEESEQKFIIVAGAISVDRSLRTEGVSYWADESIPLDADKQVKKLVLKHGSADIILTHAAATNAPHETNLSVPILNHYCATDKALLDELITERSLLQRCVDASRAKRNIYGHFHLSSDESRDGVRYTCLDELEILELSPQNPDQS